MSIFLANSAEKKIPECSHQDYQITSFCTYKSCQKTLCSYCTPSHTHPSNKNFLITLEEAHKYSLEKTEKYLEFLRYELEKVSIKVSDLEIVKHSNDDLKHILRNKQNIQKLVKKFYENLENEYNKIFYDNFDKKILEINEIQVKIEDFTHQLSEIERNLKKSNLKNPDLAKNIELSYNLDIKTEISKLSSEFKEIIERNPYKKFEKLYETTSNIEFIIKNIFHESLKILIEDSLLLPEKNQKREILSKPLNFDQLIDTSSSTSTYSITQQNYFEKNCQHKCLHFINPDDNTINMLNFDDHVIDPKQKPKFEKIRISNNDLKIPYRHRSVSLPDGSIYLIGGHYKEKNITSNETYRYNWDSKGFINRADMYTSRKSFGICYNSGFIYVVGGFNYNEGYLEKCEKYEVLKDKWTNIDSLKGGSASSCSICIFNRTQIFKFGGLKAPYTINDSIEIYDIDNNKWLNFNIDSKKLREESLNNFEFLWLSACLQINDNEIMVFGGLDKDNKSSDQSFIIKVINEEMFRVINVGQRRLRVAGGMWNQQVIIDGGKLMALQNVLMDKSGDKANENKRNFIYFLDMMWK